VPVPTEPTRLLELTVMNQLIMTPMMLIAAKYAKYFKSQSAINVNQIGSSI